MKTKEEKLYYYVTAMWYESRCKDKQRIKEIIAEELKENPVTDPKKFKTHILRRCKNEL